MLAGISHVAHGNRSPESFVAESGSSCRGRLLREIHHHRCFFRYFTPFPHDIPNVFLMRVPHPQSSESRDSHACCVRTGNRTSRFCTGEAQLSILVSEITFVRRLFRSVGACRKYASSWRNAALAISMTTLGLERWTLLDFEPCQFCESLGLHDRNRIHTVGKEFENTL